MIQLNLLPNVKLDYIKAQRSRRMVFTVSIIVSAIAIAILVFLLIVDIAQKKHLSDLNRDISSNSQTLQQKPNIGKILTVQNQLQSLTSLHSSKFATSRLINTYLDQITPTNIAINSLTADFAQYTITISGTADSLSTVNKYVDTLKFTNYTSDNNKTGSKAFSNVVLSNFGVNSENTQANQAASYTISLSFDKTIFDIAQNVTFSVPSITTTRSEIQQPAALFQSAPTKSNGGSQ